MRLTNLKSPQLNINLTVQLLITVIIINIISIIFIEQKVSFITLFNTVSVFKYLFIIFLLFLMSCFYFLFFKIGFTYYFLHILFLLAMPCMT